MLRWAFGCETDRLLIVAVIWVVADGYLRSSCAAGDSLLAPFYEWSGVDNCCAPCNRSGRMLRREDRGRDARAMRKSLGQPLLRRPR